MIAEPQRPICSPVRAISHYGIMIVGRKAMNLILNLPPETEARLR